MKIKLDENLPLDLVEVLGAQGHDAQTTVAEGLQGSDDPSVWDAAQREGRFFITQDLDFSDRRRFAPGTHCGILLIRLKNPSRRELILRIRELFRTEPTESWERCFVVATERKIRVRR